MQVWVFFFFYLLPPQEVGEKKDEGCPPASEFRCYYYLKKKKCGEGGRKRWKSNTWKKSGEKMSELCRFKTKPKKKNWFKEIKHIRMFILLNKPLNKETGWHLTTASQKISFPSSSFFILPFFLWLRMYPRGFLVSEKRGGDVRHSWEKKKNISSPPSSAFWPPVLLLRQHKKSWYRKC